MAISEQVEQMERDELEELAVTQFEYLQEFESRLGDVEERVDDVEDDVEMNKKDLWTLEDIVYGDQHDSASAELIAEEQGGVLGRVGDLERGEVSVSDVVDAGASDSELQIQRWRADVKEADHPDDVSGLSKNQARSTELWAYFPKLSDATHGKYKLTRSDATKVFRSLSDYDLPTDRNTVNRCMRFMARGTGPTDDPTDDDHLVTFQAGDQGSQSVLVANQDEFEEFVADVTGVETPDRDRDDDVLFTNPDGTESGESDASADDATDEVAEELEALSAGAAVTSVSDDSVADDHGMDGDAPTAQEL